MTSVRKQLADHIRTNWPAGQPVDVRPFGYQPEELRKPAVAVFREAIAQDGSQLDHAFKIQVFGVQATSSEALEDALDTLLDNVLTALRKHSSVTFGEAKRLVFLDVFQGWEIDASWTSQDYYKTAALSGG